MLEKLSRRKFLQLSASGAAAAILAACAPGAAPQAGSDAGAAPAATGTELIHWGRNPTEEEVVWKPIVALAKEMFPELNIVLQSPPEEMVQKLLIAFAGGTAPDTAVGGLSSFGGWIGINMINSIQPLSTPMPMYQAGCRNMCQQRWKGIASRASFTACQRSTKASCSGITKMPFWKRG